jgi:hypothetical protein
MLTPSDLDAPARLRYGPPGSTHDVDWSGAREFASLREALHVAMTEEAPAGQEPFIRTGSGTILGQSTLQGLFDSLQGP